MNQVKVLKNYEYNSEFVKQTDLFRIQTLKPGISQYVLKCYNYYINNYVIIKPRLSIQHCKASDKDKRVLDKYGIFSVRFSTSYRAVMFYECMNSLGMGAYIPITGMFLNKGLINNICSVSRFITGQQWDIKHSRYDDDLFYLGILEIIFGNNDRHSDNVLLVNNIVQLIDNEGAFDYFHIFGSKNPVYTLNILNESVPNRIKNKILNIKNDKILNLFNKYTPEDILKILNNRIEVAKRWCLLTQGNNHYNDNLGHLLDLLRCESVHPNKHVRFQNSMNKECIWSKIKRGESYINIDDDGIFGQTNEII